jgi:ABC-2 type transport system permease protein
MILPAIFVDIIVVVMAKNNVASVAAIMDQAIFASIGFELPLIFLIVVSNKLVASEIQSGAITYVVTSSVSRREIILTKMWYMIISIFAGLILQIIFSVPVIALYQNQIDFRTSAYILKLFSLTLLLFAVSGITFIASSIFNKTLWSFVMGAGIPIAFFLLNMLAMINENMEPLKYLSLNTLMTEAKVYVVDPLHSVIQHNSLLPTDPAGTQPHDIPVNWQIVNTNVGQWLPHFIALVLVGTGLYIGSGFIFCKKDLPL